MNLDTIKTLPRALRDSTDRLEKQIQIYEETKAQFDEILAQRMDFIQYIRGIAQRQQKALERLDEYIDGINPDHAKVLKMRLYEGMKWREIAEASGYAKETAVKIFRKEMNAIPPEVMDEIGKLLEGEEDVNDEIRKG